MSTLSLSQYLCREQQLHDLDPVLSRLIVSVSEACKTISFKVRNGALAGVLGMAGSENVQGEDQKKLDIISNDIFVEAVALSGSVCGMVSEEIPEVIPVPEDLPIGPYLICFDPLDGSSNIDINVSIGSIFSVLPAVRPKREPVAEDFLMPGTKQVAAGYCMYGPQTQLVLTFGRGVVMFTLDPTTGTFMLTAEDVRVDRSAKEFAINCSNMRHWEDPVKRYVAELLEGKTGVRGKDFNMRWVAAMVAEVHRIHLHVPARPPRPHEAGQASPDVRGQPDVHAHGKCRRRRHERPPAHPRHRSREDPPARGRLPRCGR